MINIMYFGRAAKVRLGACYTYIYVHWFSPVLVHVALELPYSCLCVPCVFRRAPRPPSYHRAAARGARASSSHAHSLRRGTALRVQYTAHCALYWTLHLMLCSMSVDRGQGPYRKARDRDRDNH